MAFKIDLPSNTGGGKKVVVTKPKSPPPKKQPAKKSTYTPPKNFSSGGGGTASKASSGGGGGGGGAKKSADKAQISALESLLKSGFKKARDQQLKNIDKVYKQQDAEILKSFNLRLGGLISGQLDTDRSEADDTAANQRNVSREARDQLAQASVQGAGETDTLRSQLLALRNWNYNQSEVQRAHADSSRGNQTAMSDLGASARSARINLATGRLDQMGSVHGDYQRQRVQAYTDLGNIRANPFSNSYNAKSKDYAKMAAEASKQWKNPGIDKKLTGWDPVKEKELKEQNVSKLAAASSLPTSKRPEGANLRKW